MRSDYAPVAADRLVASETHWPFIAEVPMAFAQRVALNKLALRFSCEMVAHFERYIVDYLEHHHDRLHRALSPRTAWFVRRLANLRVIERARALARPGFELRIHRSANGRMMHLKTAAFLGRCRRFVIGGQANYTPNSFNGAWLETGLAIEADHVVNRFLAQFEALWTMAPPPRRDGPLVRGSRRALLSLVERTVFTF